MKVYFYDSYIKKIEINKKVISSINLSYQKLKTYDYVIVLTDHSNLNYDLIKKYSNGIIDTRGVFRKDSSPKIIHI